MAIYSLHHGSIGRTTHAAGTAGAHLDYIARGHACLEVIGARMPLPAPGERGGAARSWLDAQEAGERKNGRVVDKLMLALPRELDAAQRIALVRGFAEGVTQGRASWLAAVHADAGNPHAHLMIRDKDPGTGKRVAGLSEKGSTDQLRLAWEQAANAALERAGQAARIDRRNLAAQGIEQPAQIHVGPRVEAMERQGKPVQSRERTTTRGRVVRWPEIDQGRSRAAHNAELRERGRAAPQRPVQPPPVPAPSVPFPPAQKSPVRLLRAVGRQGPGVQPAAVPSAPAPDVQARQAGQDELVRLLGLPEPEMARAVQRLMPEPVETAMHRQEEVRRALARVSRVAAVEARLSTILVEARHREGNAHYCVWQFRQGVQGMSFGLGHVLLAMDQVGKRLGIGKVWLQQPELRRLEEERDRHSRRVTWAEGLTRPGGPVRRIKSAAMEALQSVEAVARREVERVQGPARRLYEVALSLLAKRQAERERQEREREEQARERATRRPGVALEREQERPQPGRGGPRLDQERERGGRER